MGQSQRQLDSQLVVKDEGLSLPEEGSGQGEAESLTLDIVVVCDWLVEISAFLASK